MFYALLIAPFIVLFFLNKKELAMKIIERYFQTITLQILDVKSRTTNTWLYIFSYFNALIFVITSKSFLMLFGDSLSGASIVNILKFLICCAAIVSSITIMGRRLHDINKPWWYILVGLVFPPALFILMFMFILPGTKGRNKYGDDPRRKPYGFLY